MPIIIIRPLLISSYVVSFLYWTCQIFCVSFQVFQFYSEVCSIKTALRKRRERDVAYHTCLTYNLVSFLWSLKEHIFFVWQFTIIIGICSFEHYPFLGIALMTRPMTCNRCQTRNSNNNSDKITLKKLAFLANVLRHGDSCQTHCDVTTTRPTRHLSRTCRIISGDVV